jgi:hypothetical protein
MTKKFEAGKTYRTKDGTQARIYSTEGNQGNKIHGAIHISEGWSPQSWYSYGRSVCTKDWDLVTTVTYVKSLRSLLNEFPYILQQGEDILLHNPNAGTESATHCLLNMERDWKWFGSRFDALFRTLPEWVLEWKEE